MNDKEFDKIFGERLHEERLFSYDESEWERLSKLLDSAKTLTAERRKRRFLTMLLLLLSLPILGALVWEIGSLEKRNRGLAERLNDLQKSIGEATIKADDAKNELTKIASKKDTVRLVKYVKLPTKASGNPIFSDKLDFFPPPVSTSQIVSSGNETPSALADIKQDSLQPKLLDCEKRATELATKMAVAEQQITELKQEAADTKSRQDEQQVWANRQDSLQNRLAGLIAQMDSLKKNAALANASDTPLSIETGKSKKSSNSLRNNRLYIGLQGGTVAYKASWFNAAGIELHKNINSYQAGFFVEYAFKDKWRLIGGGDFCPFNIDVSWQDERYNIPASVVGLGEKFFKSTAKQNMFQGFLGAKYLFTEGGQKWRPYVSVAYGLLNIRPFETTHQYQKTAAPYTIRSETVESDAKMLTNLVMFTGGLEYRLNKYLSFQAETYYFKDVNRPHKAYDLFGLRGGVMLGF